MIEYRPLRLADAERRHELAMPAAGQPVRDERGALRALLGLRRESFEPPHRRRTAATWIRTRRERRLPRPARRTRESPAARPIPRRRPRSVPRPPPAPP